jgi:hypothetical protein
MTTQTDDAKTEEQVGVNGETPNEPLTETEPVAAEDSSDTGPKGVNGDSKPDAPLSLRELLQAELDAEEAELKLRLAGLGQRKKSNNINVDIVELVQAGLDDGTIVIAKNAPVLELGLSINPETQQVSMATNVSIPKVRVVAVGAATGEAVTKRRSWFTTFEIKGKSVDAPMKTDVTNDLIACNTLLGFDIRFDGQGNSTSTQPGKTNILKRNKVGYVIANNQDSNLVKSDY